MPKTDEIQKAEKIASLQERLTELIAAVMTEEDLKLRGPGDLFGIRQSGLLEFKMADVFQDAQLLKDAYEAAKEITSAQVLDMYKKYERLRQKLQTYTDDISL